MDPIERFPGSLRLTTLVNWPAGLKPKTPMREYRRILYQVTLLAKSVDHLKSKKVTKLNPNSHSLG